MDKKSASYLLWTITISDTGSVSVYEGVQRCESAKKALRSIAGEVGLEIDEKWNSQQLARKLIDHIHERERFEEAVAKAVKAQAPKKREKPEKFSQTAKRYLINSLFWKPDYRITSCILWLVILYIVSIPFSIADQLAAAKYERQMDYRSRCAEGDFTAAHKILDAIYDEYTEALARWRTNSFQSNQARILQDRYHTAATYIFGQELSARLADPTTKADDNILIRMLLDIPIEGVPLREGRYANQMFYASDATADKASIDHVVYQAWVHFYNGCCDQMLEQALMTYNFSLAEKVIERYKPEVLTSFEPDLDSQISGYDIATVTYDHSRQEAARQRLSEMVECTRP